VEKQPNPLNPIPEKCAKLIADHPSQFASLVYREAKQCPPAPGGHFLLLRNEDRMTQNATIDPVAAASTTPRPAEEPSTNPAVQRCWNAYVRALISGGGPKIAAARDNAQDAYRKTLPHFTRASIRDFIACITHGMVLGVFWKTEGPRLVAAAKAALAALPREPAPLGSHKPPPRESIKPITIKPIVSKLNFSAGEDSYIDVII
jgi:hypothetical protein